MDGLLILDHGYQVPSNVVPVPVQEEKAKRFLYIFYYHIFIIFQKNIWVKWDRSG